MKLYLTRQLAACADDCGTRIWREDKETAMRVKGDPSMDSEWAGVVRANDITTG